MKADRKFRARISVFAVLLYPANAAAVIYQLLKEDVNQTKEWICI